MYTNYKVFIKSSAGNVIAIKRELALSRKLAIDKCHAKNHTTQVDIDMYSAQAPLIGLIPHNMMMI